MSKCNHIHPVRISPCIIVVPARACVKRACAKRSRYSTLQHSATTPKYPSSQTVYLSRNGHCARKCATVDEPRAATGRALPRRNVIIIEEQQRARRVVTSPMPEGKEQLTRHDATAVHDQAR